MRVHNIYRTGTIEQDEFPRAFEHQKEKEKRRRKGVLFLVGVVYLLIALALLIRFYIDTFKDGILPFTDAAVAGNVETDKEPVMTEEQEGNKTEVTIAEKPEEIETEVVTETEPPAKDLKLSEANHVTRNMVNIGEVKDRRGNWYKDAIAADTDGAYIVFNPEYKYKYLRGTIASGLEKYSAEINIYGDDVLLYTSEKFDIYSAPQEFECNIEGVDLLRLEFTVDGNSLSYDPLIVADAVFTNNE